MVFWVVKFSKRRIFGFLLALLCMSLLVLLLPHRPAATGVSAINEEEERLVLPIIMYHEVKPFKAGKDSITPMELENDLKYLRDNDYSTISMSQLIDYVENGTPLPENPIILSFDDGYLNNYVYVLPLLKEYDMQIVFSIIGQNTDDFTECPDSNLDYSHVTWEQLGEMLDTGLVEVQNHTYNLHYMKNGRIGCARIPGETMEHYEKVLTSDISMLQEKLFAMTGQAPNTFAYPYGRYSEDTDTVLRKLGFKATLSCRYGVNVITSSTEDLYGLKRICRSHGQGLKKVLLEAMETLKYM